MYFSLLLTLHYMGLTLKSLFIIDRVASVKQGNNKYSFVLLSVYTLLHEPQVLSKEWLLRQGNWIVMHQDVSVFVLCHLQQTGYKVKNDRKLCVLIFCHRMHLWYVLRWSSRVFWSTTTVTLWYIVEQPFSAELHLKNDIIKVPKNLRSSLILYPNAPLGFWSSNRPLPKGFWGEGYI